MPNGCEIVLSYNLRIVAAAGSAGAADHGQVDVVVVAVRRFHVHLQGVESTIDVFGVDAQHCTLTPCYALQAIVAVSSLVA